MDTDRTQLALGDPVEWDGRDCVLRGTEPMSIAERRAELEDVRTGERFLVPLGDLVADRHERS